MKWLNCEKIRMLLVVFVAAIVLSGGWRAKAEIIMSEPINVGPVINDAGNVQECDFSSDGLKLYFCGSGGIRVATRESTESDWSERGPVIITGVDPAISPDDLELYFDIWGDWYLRVATRPSKDEPWGNPVKIGPPVGSYDAYTADISADGLSLYFASYERPGGYGEDDIWVATRATINDEWGEPVNLGPNVNSSGSDLCPSISSDGLTLVFNRGPWGGILASTRNSVDDEWSPAVNLNINNPGYFYGPALSPDGSTIYFDASAAWGGYGDDDIWQVTFTPVVDFNGDGNIDTDDLLILIEHWGQEDLSCDIAPLPLGDGVVDIEDLKVFIEYWEQENMPDNPENEE
jgi:hypothetical protein